MVDDRLENLLLTWQEQWCRGIDVPAEELCRDCPELIAELGKRIKVLRQLDALLQPVPGNFATRGGSAATPAAAADNNPATASSQPVSAIAGYKIIAPLDVSEQGAVYRAVHPMLGKDVVIVMRRCAAQVDEGALVREGRVLAELDDPGIARIYDLFLHENHVCLVMDFVRGRNLAQEAGRFKTTQAAAKLLVRVAKALASAHRRGVAHGDIKPSNIVVDELGHPVVVNLGVNRFALAGNAEAVKDTALAGSYHAPEHMLGQSASAPGDIFALGGVLYFLLTGGPPFEGARGALLREKQAPGEWDRSRLSTAGVPRRLQRFIDRSLSAHPGARPSTQEFIRTLERYSRPAGARWAVAFLSLLSAAALALGIWHFSAHDDSAPKGTQQEGQSHGDAGARAAGARDFAMQVRVWRLLRGSGRFLDLAAAVPIKTGDEIRIETTAPAGMYAAIFTRGSSGKFAQHAAVTPGDGERLLSFPANVNAASRLTGPAGNELILMCAGRVPVREHDIGPLLSECGDWPPLAADCVLELGPAGLRIIQKTRDAGSVPKHARPQAAETGLENLRQRLLAKFEYFEAVLFFHGD